MLMVGYNKLKRLWNHFYSNPDDFVACSWKEWVEHGTPIRVGSVLVEILTGHFPNASPLLIQSMTDFL